MIILIVTTIWALSIYENTESVPYFLRNLTKNVPCGAASIVLG